jgi:hypothetical protein
MCAESRCLILRHMSHVRIAISMVIVLRESEDHFGGNIDSVVADLAVEPRGKSMIVYKQIGVATA